MKHNFTRQNVLDLIESYREFFTHPDSCDALKAKIAGLDTTDGSSATADDQSPPGFPPGPGGDN